MTRAAAEAFSDRTTAAALEEKAKLQLHFGRFDLFFFLLCTLVGLDTIGSAAARGPQSFTWLLLLGVAFFVPYGLLSAELGSAFPAEGGAYVWTRLAFGRLPAALHAVLYWISNPIWLGGSLTILALTAYGEFFTPLQGAARYAFSIAFIWTAVLAAILSFRVGKWIPAIGACVRIAVLGFFTLSVLLYALRNGVTGGFALRDFAPSYATFIAVVPVLFFNYVGFELPSAAGEEMKDPQRDVPYAVVRSAVGTFLLYGAPILAILLLLPKNQVTNLRGFLDSIKTVFTVYGGRVDASGPILLGAGRWLGGATAIAFIAALLSSGTTWLMGADRAIAAAGFDGAAPRSFGRISARYGTPVVVNLWSGVLSTAVMLLAFALSGGNADRYFNAVLSLAISTTTISYLFVFPALGRLRQLRPEVARPYRVPGGDRVAWAVSALTAFWAALATASLLWPGFGVGWFGSTGHPDDALEALGFGGQRLAFELTQLVPLGAIIAVGFLFHARGRRTREHLAGVPALLVLLLLGASSGVAAAEPARFEYDKLRDEAAALLSEYLRIDTTNPPGNELATAQWLQKVLEKEGIEGRILDTDTLGPGRANFYARLPGDGSRKGIALVHHMDVVPVSREFWSVDPFAGTVKDGHVWGRGALDMKGHGIIQLMALIAIKRAGIPLQRDLVYIGNADEEVNGDGAIQFVKRHADLLQDVEYLLTEGADTRVENGKVRWFGIDVGEKRPLWTRLVVQGKTSHGSVPIGDQNPVPRLARAVARAAAWKTPIHLTPAVDRFFKAMASTETGQHRAWLANAGETLRDPQGLAWLQSEPERNALLRNTISPTVLTGSTKTNVIPQVASAELDIRLLPDQDPDAFRRELVRVIGDPKVKLEEIAPLTPRYDAPLDTELFHAIEHVVAQILPGVPVATPVSPGASDRPTYAQAGIVCYGIDPWLVPIEENRSEVHGNDERLSVENVGFGVKLYLELLQRMEAASL